MTHPAPSRISWPRGAVFDCDGLLADTAECWRQASCAAIRASGADPANVDLTTPGGFSTSLIADHLSNTLAVPVRNTAVSEALLHAVSTEPIEAMRGAAALLTRLANDMPLAVASNAPQVVVETVLERINLRRYFSAVISADSDGIYKPSPDVYLRACRELGIDASDAIAFEDSAVGARAANAAGMIVIVVPTAPDARAWADLVAPRLDDQLVLGLLRIDLRRATQEPVP